MSRSNLVSKNLLANCFRNFSKKKKNSVITRKFCETPTSKYRKSSVNDQFNKILDLEREKPKNCPEKSANFAEIAKVTRIFLALVKRLGNKYGKIAGVTNLTKF